MAEVAELVDLADNVFEKFSWRHKKEVAISTYAYAMQLGYGKMGAYQYASFATRVQERTVRGWIAAWAKGPEGFLSACNWGKNSVPTTLGEEDVIAASKQWWFDRAPKKGGRCFLVAFALLPLPHRCCCRRA